MAEAADKLKVVLLLSLKQHQTRLYRWGCLKGAGEGNTAVHFADLASVCTAARQQACVGRLLGFLSGSLTLL